MKDSAAETSGMEEGELHPLGQGEEQHTHTHSQTCRSFVERLVPHFLFICCRVCSCLSVCVCQENNSPLDLH